MSQTYKEEQYTMTSSELYKYYREEVEPETELGIKLSAATLSAVLQEAREDYFDSGCDLKRITPKDYLLISSYDNNYDAKTHPNVKINIDTKNLEKTSVQFPLIGKVKIDKISLMKLIRYPGDKFYVVTARIYRGSGAWFCDCLFNIKKSSPVSN